MIPVRRNIDTDKLILWLDPSSPLSYGKSETIISIAGRGKNQFAGTEAFTNTYALNGVKSSWTYELTSARGRRFLEPILDGMILDPDGGNQTRLLRETADTGQHFFRQDMLIEGNNIGPSERVTYSMYVREDLTSAPRQIRISYKNTFPDTGGVRYDFATSTLTPLNESALEDYGVIPASGGWVRIFFTVKIDGAEGSGLTARTFIYLIDGSGDDVYAGDGTSGVYAYGPQWEQGVLSNYVKVDDGGEFAAGFQNRKLGKGSLTVNPSANTTTFEGTNLRFNGVSNGIASLSGPRNPFRSTGIDNFSLKDHTAFAWIKFDSTGTPTGSDQVSTVMGRIGGKSNNGVFGMKPDGTKIRYKVRARYSTPSGGISIPIAVLESNAFSDINGGWNLIAADFDYLTGTVNFYLNGTPVGSDSLSVPPTYTPLGIDGSGSGVQIGNYSQTGGITLGEFKGMMNIIGFYDKALSAAEHLALYNATKYRFI